MQRASRRGVERKKKRRQLQIHTIIGCKLDKIVHGRSKVIRLDTA
jgi:hypothetical protein